MKTAALPLLLAGHADYQQRLRAPSTLPLPGNVLVGNHSYYIRVNSSQPASTALSSEYISIGNKTYISYSGSLCVGSVVNINYSYTGCPLAPGNVFNVEMSNASGSFASPIVIGTLTSNATSGTIPVAVPANTANGSGYKMRLTTSNPVAMFMQETGFGVGSSYIYADYNGSQMCAGGTATVTYDATGCLNTFQSGNVFTVQLSNASGSFASPVNIGTRTTTDPDGSINVTLPANLASANYYNGYQIRVVSSNPAITGSGNSVWADAGITDIYLTSYPSGGLCANGSIAVGFQTYGCTPSSSNIYRLQMSTTSAFTSATNIGSLTSTTTGGTVTGTIPAGTTGIRYFRVVSTSPVQLYSDYFSKNVGQPVITVGTVADDCAGSMLPVPYTTSGCAYGSGNVFTVELSSNGGSFSTPVALGTVASTAASGTLNVGNIPSSTSYGNSYRVRVKSSNPASDWAY
ncbi:MAG: hypothetical protein IPH78_11110, partial [Bacteroidetes bacterium]|nr:hypothetical protein [Bacteroidota bacterium]